MRDNSADPIYGLATYPASDHDRWRRSCNALGLLGMRDRTLRMRGQIDNGCFRALFLGHSLGEATGVESGTVLRGKCRSSGAVPARKPQ
jgi:hypothetical protein